MEPQKHYTTFISLACASALTAAGSDIAESVTISLANNIKQGEVSIRSITGWGRIVDATTGKKYPINNQAVGFTIAPVKSFRPFSVTPAPGTATNTGTYLCSLNDGIIHEQGVILMSNATQINFVYDYPYGALTFVPATNYTLVLELVIEIYY